MDNGLRGTGAAFLVFPRIRGALDRRHVGQRTVGSAVAMQDDAVIEIGGCEARIVLNRQIVRGEGRDGSKRPIGPAAASFVSVRSRSRRDRYVGRCFALTLNALSVRVGRTGSAAAKAWSVARALPLSASISAALGGFEKSPNRV